MDSPCHFCTERTATCHGTCEKYRAFRDELDTINEKKRKDREFEDTFRSSRKRVERLSRQYHHKH